MMKILISIVLMTSTLLAHGNSFSSVGTRQQINQQQLSQEAFYQQRQDPSAYQQQSQQRQTPEKQYQQYVYGQEPNPYSDVFSKLDGEEKLNAQIEQANRMIKMVDGLESYRINPSDQAENITVIVAKNDEDSVCFIDKLALNIYSGAHASFPRTTAEEEYRLRRSGLVYTIKCFEEDDTFIGQAKISQTWLDEE